ncbi:shikimate 5-dehydrogenase [Mycolicibacterium sp. BK556]|nr:shikimate 5-dehydrogenase [Mycolicibacterium sp. BK556]MBB3636372.1 shikimate 5-dehydrogenase [Mycolicibacterium sp. BK607]
MTDAFAFVGVDTARSAVNGVFADWCAILEREWILRHVDIPVDAEPPAYEECLDLVSASEYVGGLVTTHKARIFDRCRDRFHYLEPICEVLGEVGILFKDETVLCGGVSDVVSGRHILSCILDQNESVSREYAVVIGAGGAGLAAAWNLGVEGVGDFSSVVVVENSAARVDRVLAIIADWPCGRPVKVVSSEAGFADDILSTLPMGGLVVNATGMGKDRPGSPIRSADCLPDHCIVWEFNYRGTLDMLRMATSVSPSKGVVTYDGFDYFACGWSVVMSRVAHSEWSPAVYERFRSAAARLRH